MKRRSFLKGLLAVPVAVAVPVPARIIKRPLTDTEVDRIVHLWCRALQIDRDGTKAWYLGENTETHVGFIMTALRIYILNFEKSGRQGCSLTVLGNECKKMPVDNLHQILWALEHAEESIDWRSHEESFTYHHMS